VATKTILVTFVDAMPPTARVKRCHYLSKYLLNGDAEDTWMSMTVRRTTLVRQVEQDELLHALIWETTTRFAVRSGRFPAPSVATPSVSRLDNLPDGEHGTSVGRIARS
jgi:hypothetical protein